MGYICVHRVELIFSFIKYQKANTFSVALTCANLFYYYYFGFIVCAVSTEDMSYRCSKFLLTALPGRQV